MIIIKSLNSQEKHFWMFWSEWMAKQAIDKTVRAKPYRDEKALNLNPSQNAIPTTTTQLPIATYHRSLYLRIAETTYSTHYPPQNATLNAETTTYLSLFQLELIQKLFHGHNVNTKSWLQHTYGAYTRSWHHHNGLLFKFMNEVNGENLLIIIQFFFS